MPRLHITTEHGHSGHVTVHARGELDATTARELRYHAEAATFLRGPCELHLDLSRVDAAPDYAWTPELVAAYKTASQRFCTFLLCQPAPGMLPLLAAAGLPVCDRHSHARPCRRPASSAAPAARAVCGG